MDEKFVVVPWAPGPLIVPTSDAPTRDEVDELVDELFGPDIDEKPGGFDAAFLAVGVALLVASTTLGWPTALVVVGAIAALLGAVLPVRSLWRAARRRTIGRRRSAALSAGLALFASDPATGRLISAYGRLEEAAAPPGMAAFADDARSAAHQAMIEAATLLDGAAPDGPAEQEYVTQRARAVEALAVALERRHSLQVETDTRHQREAEQAELRLARTARLEATAELDDRLGPASLDRLSLLARELEAGPDGDL